MIVNFALNLTSFVMLLAFSAFYRMGMEMSFGGTAGKLLTGLRVRKADGSPVGFRGALMRYLFQWIDPLFFYLVGIVSIKSTSKHQRLGDTLGGTMVVYRNATYVENYPTIRPKVSWQGQ